MTRTIPALPTLVELNESTAERLIFCLHPAGGGLRPYELLAQRLAPVAKMYGLEDPYIYDEEPFESLPELAEYHADTIRTVQPEGPYTLFGSCSGGPVAYETACQLALDGARVDRIVMFGSHGLVGFDPREAERFAFLAPYLASRYAIDTHALDWPSFEGRSRTAVCGAIVAHLIETGFVPTDMDPEWIVRTLDSLCRTREATKGYRPPRSKLDIDLYKQPRSEEQRLHTAKDWCDWDQLTTGTLKVVPHDPALHASDDILGPAHIDATVSTLLRETLGRAPGNGIDRKPAVAAV